MWMNQPLRRAGAVSVAVTMAQLLIVVLLSSFGVFSSNVEFTAEMSIQPLCWAIVLMFLWSIWSWYLVTRNLFDWYLIFLTAVTVFNGGQAFLEVFHLNRHGLLDGKFSTDTLMHTLYMVLLGLSSLHLGALLAAKPASVRRIPLHLLPISPESTTSMRLVGMGLLLISVPCVFLLTKEAVEIVLTHGYFGLYQADAVSGWPLGMTRALAGFLIPGALFLLTISRDSLGIRYFTVGVIVMYAAVYFFLGSRHEATAILVAAAWIWHRQIRPISPVLLTSCALGLVFVVFPLISITRDRSGSERTSMSYLSEQFSNMDSPAVAAIQEMGGTMMTEAHTYELVPSQRGFDMGASYGYAALALFPNLFWDIHPTVKSEMPGKWLTWEVDPYFASQGGGLGYSLISEAYLNFGWYGVPIVMLITGFVWGRLVSAVNHNRSPEYAVLIASMANFVLFYARSESALILRSLIWYAVLPYFAVLALNSVQRLYRGHVVLTRPSATV
ncbi:MAG: O-antigen polysaccharide polymerase Wzy [Planctomycetaceae bacterium]